jgi:hypothetical protein
LGRNAARSHPFYQADLGLHKSCSLPLERLKLEFRGEAFNLFNQTNFRAADANRTNLTFGTIRATLPPRRVQLALGLAW